MKMDKEKFYIAKNEILNIEKQQQKDSVLSLNVKKGIGTLNERTLHAVLKRYLSPDESKTEIKVGSYYADIKNEDGIIEIQTRNFRSLKNKLEFFLRESEVTVVYPIAYRKWLIWLDTETGELTKKRKSPKVGRTYDVFIELYAIKHLLTHENFNLKIILLEIEEYRYLNGWSKNKKKGSERMDRIPIDIYEEIDFLFLCNYLKLVPDSLPEEFTVKDFKKHTNTSLRNSQIGVNILSSLGVINKVGKAGRAFLYKRNESLKSSKE